MNEKKINTNRTEWSENFSMLDNYKMANNYTLVTFYTRNA